MPTFPNITSELIEFLERLYPAKNPAPSQTLADIQFNAGQRDVVLMLTALRKDQETGLTEGLRSHVLLQSAVGGSAAEDRNPGPASATSARTAGSPGNRLRSDA